MALQTAYVFLLGGRCGRLAGLGLRFRFGDGGLGLRRGLGQWRLGLFGQEARAKVVIVFLAVVFLAARCWWRSASRRGRLQLGDPTLGDRDRLERHCNNVLERRQDRKEHGG